MEQISVFDIIKIGIGPSSSHTMGPWKAAQMSLEELETVSSVEDVCRVQIDLYGSLAKTGKGHGTEIAVLLGLSGENHVTIDTNTVEDKVEKVRASGKLLLLGKKRIPFDFKKDLRFHREMFLPFHPNGLKFTYELVGEEKRGFTYFSIGGGFVIKENENVPVHGKQLPFPIQSGDELAGHCEREGKSIAEIVRENEKTWRTLAQIRSDLDQLWETMQACVYKGCYTEGELPGGLNVKRRAPDLNRKLLENVQPATRSEWLQAILDQHPSFHRTLRWVSCFAIATNEENAAFGRIVTAPTNGAAGVIPAVLFYYVYFCENVTQEKIRNFLLVAGEIGSVFKKGATISAAMGGCQAEIGVSSAMAAAALTECLDGNPGQALMAAEIAMEHHLGLTCDPVGGLVQVPCIERNTMGAIKAITAANLALESDPKAAKVSLDAVIRSMWETAQNMNTKYKETAEGGLAAQIPVNVIDC